MQQFVKFRYRILSVIVLVGILCGSFGSGTPVFAQTVPPDRPGFALEEPLTEAVYAPDRVIVKLAPRMQAATTARLQSEMGAKTLHSFTLINSQLWQVPEGTVAEVVARYADDPRFVYVEPDYQVSISPLAPNALAEGDALVLAAQTPNDPHWKWLWGMRAIAAPAAWETTTGAEVLIGVIDSGVDITHPDLAANIWTNPGEIAGNNVDDDGNGYVDDVHGWDFVGEDNDPQDGFGHGTHVAGTIAAVGNNALGVAGVNWSAKIVPLKFSNEAGIGYYSDAIEAIEYAVAMDVKVTNYSWGGLVSSQALYDAIAAAGEAGHLLVVASGNSGLNGDVSAIYPTCYDLENIITVAATNEDGSFAWPSTYGPHSVDLSAPGSEILSTVPGAGYRRSTGTSMAAPHVAGVAGLLWEQFPDADFQEVKQRILYSTDLITKDLDGSHTFTDGRLNAAQALAYNGLSLSPGSFIFDTLLFDVPLTRSLQVGWLGAGSGTWQATVSEPWLSVSPVSGTVSAGLPLTVSLMVDPTEFLSVGRNYGQVTFSVASDVWTIPVELMLRASEPLSATHVKLASAKAAKDEAIEFGRTVALSGDIAVVGSRTSEDALNPYGPAYFYSWTGSAWEEISSFEGGAGEAPVGVSVAVSGDIALIGDPSGDTKSKGGVVNVYRWADDTWSKDAPILAPSDQDVSFGETVALDGDVAFVRSFDSASERIIVYAFRWDGSMWREEAKLEQADVSNYWVSEFGYAIVIDGDVAVIGDPGLNMAYIYRWNGTVWVQQSRAMGVGAEKGFGASVAVDGDRVMVGVPGAEKASVNMFALDGFYFLNSGAAYVYQWNGSQWVEQAKLTHPDSDTVNGFGYAVALSGDTALVSAPLSHENVPYAGAVYIYHWSGEQWVGRSLDAQQIGQGSFLSRSIALEGSRALLGAQNADEGLGAAYMYDLPDGDPQIHAVLPSLTLTYSESQNLPITVPLAIANTGTEALTWQMINVPDYVYTQTSGTLAPQEEVTLAMRIENWGGPVVIASNSIYGNVFYVPVEPYILYPFSVHLPVVSRGWRGD